MVLQGRLCGRVGRCQIYGPVPREGDRPFFCGRIPAQQCPEGVHPNPALESRAYRAKQDSPGGIRRPAATALKPRRRWIAVVRAAGDLAVVREKASAPVSTKDRLGSPKGCLRGFRRSGAAGARKLDPRVVGAWRAGLGSRLRAGPTELLVGFETRLGRATSADGGSVLGASKALFFSQAARPGPRLYVVETRAGAVSRPITPARSRLHALPRPRGFNAVGAGRLRPLGESCLGRGFRLSRAGLGWTPSGHCCAGIRR